MVNSYFIRPLIPHTPENLGIIYYYKCRYKRSIRYSNFELFHYPEFILNIYIAAEFYHRTIFQMCMLYKISCFESNHFKLTKNN